MSRHPIAFVLASTQHGMLIVNRNDYAQDEAQQLFGVGHQLLNHGHYEPEEIHLLKVLLQYRKQYFGPGVLAIDGGANIGVHSIEWAREMRGWGSVFAFEAQEALYYALGGNIALNNCLNVRARLAALGEHVGKIAVPQPNYFQPGSFGSVELTQRPEAQFMGQALSYAEQDCPKVPLLTLDSLGLQRVDLIKLDLEGMELDALRGGQNCVRHCQPILLVEHLKSDRQALETWFSELGYRHFNLGYNLLAVHEADPTLQHIAFDGRRLSLRA